MDILTTTPRMTTTNTLAPTEDPAEAPADMVLDLLVKAERALGHLVRAERVLASRARDPPENPERAALESLERAVGRVASIRGGIMTESGTRGITMLVV